MKGKRFLSILLIMAMLFSNLVTGWACGEELQQLSDLFEQIAELEIVEPSLDEETDNSGESEGGSTEEEPQFVEDGSLLEIQTSVPAMDNTADGSVFEQEEAPVSFAELEELFIVGEETDESFVISEDVLEAYKGNEESVIVPEGIRVIGEYAFADNDVLKHVELAESVQVIAPYAFANCGALELISGGQLLEVGEYAFQNCKKLDASFVDEVSAVAETAFDGCADVIEQNTNDADVEGEAGTEEQGEQGEVISFLKIENMLSGATASWSDGPVVSAEQTGANEVTVSWEAEIPAEYYAIKEVVGGKYTTSVIVGNVREAKLTGVANGVHTYVVEPRMFVDGVLKYGDYSEAVSVEVVTQTAFTTIENEDGTLTITGYEGEVPAELVIPAQIGGKDVKQIARSAFYGCSSLVSVEVAEGVEVLGGEAFAECVNLVSAKLPDTMTSIPYGAFWLCEKLQNISFSDNLQEIGDYAFMDCASLQGISIPAGVARIENDTFAGCTSLASVELSEGLEYIGIQAFQSCESLKEIDIPTSVSGIGAAAFRFCSGLEEIELHDGITMIEWETFHGCASLESIVIPEGVTSIGDMAFYECSNLASIVIPESVKTISYEDTFEGCAEDLVVTVDFESDAYWYCIEMGHRMNVLNAPEFAYTTSDNEDGSLTITGHEGVAPEVLEIPAQIGDKAVTAIGKAAFAYSPNITTIVVPEGVIELQDQAFKHIYGLTSISLPDTLKHIGDECFENCYNLPAISLPEDLESIGTYTFWNCKALTELTIPGSVKVIPGSAVADCDNLKTVVLNEGVCEIHEYAFTGCVSLESITIPKSVNVLKERIFEGCSSDLVVTVEYNSAAHRHFEDTGITLNVLNAPKLAFTTSENEDGTLTITGYEGEVPAELVIPSELDGKAVTVIGERALTNGYDSLVSVIIEDGIHTIDACAFEGCGELKQIQLPSSLKTIGDSAFFDCVSLDGVILPEGLETIDHAAFYCTDLTSIEIPDTVTYLGGHAFASTNLRSVKLPAGITAIEDYTFLSCDLRTVEIPDHVTRIGRFAFCSNANLTNVIIPESVIEISEWAFEDSYNVSLTVVVGSYAYDWCNAHGVNYIPVGEVANESLHFEVIEEEKEDGTMASFARITGFEGNLEGTLAIPGEIGGFPVVEIGGNAFENCGKLTGVTIPASVVRIANSAFQSCSLLSSVTLNEGLVEIGNHAFSGTNLVEIRLPGTVKVLKHNAFENLNKDELKKIYIPAGVEEIGADLVTGGRYVTFVLETEDCLAKEYAVANNIPYDAGNGYNLHVFDLIYEGEGHVGGTGLWIPFVIGGEEEHEYRYVLYRNGSETPVDETEWTGDDRYSYTFTESGEYVCYVSVRDVVDSEVIAEMADIQCKVTISDYDDNIGYNYALLEDGTVKLTGIDYEWYGSNVTLPTTVAGYTVSTIGEHMFSNRHEFVSIVIPEGYTDIDNGAFYEMHKLKSISLPDTLKKIGDDAFGHCYALESITIPGSVETIGRAAFQECGGLRCVVIENGASGLEGHAFSSCGSLESIEIAGSIGEIPVYAFENCGSLREIKLGEGIHTIGDSAFVNCGSLKAVELPDSVKTIWNAAFRGCGSLESINLPNGLTYLGDEAFRDCHNLMYITIPGGVQAIKNNTFFNCGSMVEVELNEGTTTIEGGAFDNCGSLRKINIPDSVNRIDWHAFHNCGSLGEVEFPAAEMSIDCDAFAGSSIIMVVEVDSAAYHYARSENIRYIALGTASVDQLQFEIDRENFTAQLTGYGPLNDEEEYIELSGTLTIPAFIPVPDEEAEGGIRNYAVTEIGNNALCGYHELTGLVIPDSVVRIGNRAFADNHNLRSLKMSANVQYIDQDAFINAKGIEEVTIPASCTFLGGGAFAYCDNLQKLVIFGKEVSFDDGCTLDGTDKVVIYCQEGSSAQAFANEKDFPVVIIDAAGNILQDCLAIRDVEIYKYVGHIGGTAIWKIRAVGYEGNREYQYQLLRNEDEYGEPSEWTSEESFSFTFTEDGDYQLLVRARAEAETGNEAAPADAFEEDFVVEGGSTGAVEEKNYIYSDDFVDDEFLFISHDNEETPFRYIIVGENEVRVTGYNQEYPETLVIPETIPVPDEEAEGGYRDYTVIEIGAYAFSDNDQIRNVEIPESVVSIMFGAFARNHSLTSVEIPEGVDRIAHDTFEECGNLEAVTLFSDENGNGNITEIGNYAFAGCERLGSINLPEGLTEIGEGAFEGCGELNALTLPQSLTTIRSGAFKSTGLTAITIPDAVTTMEWDAFAESNLYSVTLGKGLTYLDSCVFYYCCNLEEINLEESNIARIGGSAFEHCCNLKHITMPDSVTEIAHRVFCDCYSLVSAVMSDGLTDTGMATFENCHRLHSVTLPEKLESIGNWAFKNCHRLFKIEIPQTVNSIGEYAFEECHDLNELTLPGGDMDLGDGIFNNSYSVRLIVEAGSRAHDYACEWGVEHVVMGTADADRLMYEFDDENMTATVVGYNGEDENGEWHSPVGTLTIPGTVVMDGETYAVTVIEAHAIEECGEMTGLVIEDGVEAINDCAFAGNQNLRSVSLPNTLEVIGSEAFHGCSSLVEVTIPDGCVTLGGGAFANCNSLRKLVIPESVVNFDYEYNLVDNSPLAVIYCQPESEAEAYAFDMDIPYNNGTHNTLAILQMRNIYWAGNVGETGAWEVTANGNNLEYCYILHKGEDIEDETGWVTDNTYSYTFEDIGIYSLEVSVRDKNDPDNYVNDVCQDKLAISDYDEETGFNYALNDRNEEGEWLVAITGYNRDEFGYPDGVLTIPATIKGMVVNEIYDNAFNGHDDLCHVVLNDTIERIGNGAFYNCDGLESINFSNSPVYEIDDGAFEECYGLGAITVPGTTWRIGDSAFRNSGIDSIKLGAAITEICNHAFDGCGELTSVDMSACIGLEEIPFRAFYNCDALESIVIPDSVHTIYDEAFANSGLKSVTLGSGVKDIRSCAFIECCALESINLGESNVTGIGGGAFECCCSLKSITIPDSVTWMAHRVFYNCGALETAVMGNGLTNTGMATFENCYSLKSVTLPANLETVNNWCFKNCHRLENLELPGTVTEIGECAFEECHSLGELVIPDGMEYISEDSFANVDIVLVVKPETYGMWYVQEYARAYRVEGETAEQNFEYYISDELNGAVITGYNGDLRGDLVIPDTLEGDDGEDYPVVMISEWAFCDQPNLMSVSIPASVKFIAEGAFAHCWRMHTVTIGEGSVLEEIGRSAFESCEYLSSINLEAAEDLKIINEWAFSNCHHLFELTIPASVIGVGENMTWDCPFIVLYVTAGTAGENYAIEYELAYDKGDGIELTVQMLEVVEQADSIGQTAAWETCWIGGKGDVTFTYELHRAGEHYATVVENTEEERVEFEFTENGEYWMEVIATDSEGNTFSRKANERVIISDYDENSGYYFSIVHTGNFGDEGLGHVAITGADETVTGEVTIPATLTLNEVTYSVVEICGGAFEDRDDITSIVVPEGVYRVGQFAFVDMSELIYAQLPSTLEEINEGTFQYCHKLETVVLPSARSIGDQAFLHNFRLKNFTLPENLEEIGEGAFADCHDLKITSIPDGVWRIGHRAFANCHSLERIWVSENTEELGGEIFDGCGGIVIAANVGARILEYALDYGMAIDPVGNVDLSRIWYAIQNGGLYITGYEGYAIGDLVIPDVLETEDGTFPVTCIYGGAFSGQPGLMSVTLGANVTELAGNAFSYCWQLRSVDASAGGLTSIGGSAFEGCESLHNVSLAEGLKSIGNGAFAYCNSLGEITIPASVTTMEDNIFLDSLRVALNVTAGHELVIAYADRYNIPCNINGEGFDLTVLEVAVEQYAGWIEEEAGWRVYAIGGEGALQYQYQLYRNGVPGDESEWTEDNGFYCEITENGTYEMYARVKDETGAMTDYKASSGVVYVSDAHEESGFHFVQLSATEAMITGISDEAWSEELEIPANLGFGEGEEAVELTVVGIGAEAFAWHDDLRSVILPDTIEFIGRAAFADDYNLESINLPEGLEEIEEDAFIACESLGEITLPSTLKAIGGGAFAYCEAVTEISVPDSVTSMGNAVFEGCASLASVELPSGLKKITYHMFNGCESLTGIEIPGSVTVIQEGAFSESGLTAITIPASVECIEANAFDHCSALETLNLNEGLQVIDAAAFLNNSSLKALNLPNSVVRVHAQAFQGCSALETVVLSDNLEHVTNWCFAECSSLTSIVIPESVGSIGRYTFADCVNLKTVTMPTGRNMTAIEQSAFFNCRSLESIEIPDSVHIIEPIAFDSCYSLKSVKLPAKLEFLANYVFANCHSLESIEIPEGVELIGKAAFAECYALTEVVIPEGVTSIGEDCFYLCENLASVTVPATVEEIGYNQKEDRHAFDGAADGFVLIVEADSYAVEYAETNGIDYRFKALVYGDFLYLLNESNDGVTIVEYTGEDSSVTVPETIDELPVTEIGNSAFEGNTTLTAIDLPDTVAVIGVKAFANCTSLATMN